MCQRQNGLYGRSRCDWRDDPPAARPTHAMRRTTRRDREGYALRRPRAAAQASNEGARLEADAMANPARRLGAIPSRHALTSPRLTGGVWVPNTTQKKNPNGGGAPSLEGCRACGHPSTMMLPTTQFPSCDSPMHDLRTPEILAWVDAMPIAE